MDKSDAAMQFKINNDIALMYLKTINKKTVFIVSQKSLKKVVK
jgi:hypothetical protein